MMNSMILAGFLALCLVFAAWAVLALRQGLSMLLSAQQSSQESTSAGLQELRRQVADLRQSMAGVVNNLHTVGNQVQHLNVLADHAMQEAQHAQEYEYYEEDEDPTASPRILIEVRPVGGGLMLPQQGNQPPQLINPEDLSPEMLEKFKTFRSVYTTLIHHPDLPSRRRPDLN